MGKFKTGDRVVFSNDLNGDYKWVTTDYGIKIGEMGCVESDTSLDSVWVRFDSFERHPVSISNKCLSLAKPPATIQAHGRTYALQPEPPYELREGMWVIDRDEGENAYKVFIDETGTFRLMYGDYFLSDTVDDILELFRPMTPEDLS